MHGIDHATPAAVLMLLCIIGPVLYYIYRAQLGQRLFVRRIAGIDAIDEASGRAAELGRPISFTTGLTSLGPVLYACLGVLSYVARRAARHKSRVLLPQNAPDVMAISEDVLRDAYRLEGRLHLFDPKSVQFLSEEQFAFAAGYIGMIQREKVASAFLFGTFAAESLILAEAGQQVGAMQVGATVSPEQVAFFIVACDYTLIGEELFAASAYLTNEPVQMGSLYGQDRAKLALFMLIVVGVAVSTWNSVVPGTALPDIAKLLMTGWP